MKLRPVFVLMASIAIGSFALSGCSDSGEIETPEIQKDTEGKHVHEHAAHGPHDGHIIELGDEQYHAELVHDDASHTVTVYILDGSVKNAAPIAAESISIKLIADGQPKEFTLTAQPLEGEADGQSSRFVLESEELLHEMEEEGSKPRLSFSIGDQQFNGDISMDDHDHEGHDDHDDHDDHGDHDEDDHKEGE